MSPSLSWRAEDLWEALLPLAPGLSIEVLPSVGSTNSALLERARLGDESPCLMVAEQQTAGRGRQGKTWWSQAGDSLTFSLALPYAPADWSGLSLVVGLAVAEALDPDGSHIGIKWPNDLWLRGDDRKLGGILIETSTLAGSDHKRRWAVIGIGLNIAPRNNAGAGEVGDTAAVQFQTGHAALREWLPALDAPAALHCIAPALLRAVQGFEAKGFEPWRSRFSARDVLAGRTVIAGATQGLADGIDAQGQLLIHSAAGRTAVASGEVSVRPC